MRCRYWISQAAIGVIIASSVWGQVVSTGPADPSAGRVAAKTLKVSAVQMRSSRDLQANLAKTVRFLRQCAGQGSRVVVFPECSVTGYFEDAIRQTTAEQLADAERHIGEACRDANVYAVVGMPTRANGRLYNSAVILSPEGRVIERFHKMQLVEGWPSPGEHLSIYRIDGIWCTTIICHDERYPELVRLPVLAGAQVVFYLSHESGLREERKIEPYRAQIQAWAVENGVYVVHANAPANDDATGSHGQSRIIGPDGTILTEASIFREKAVTATLALARATRTNALNAFRNPLLRSW